MCNDCFSIVQFPGIVYTDTHVVVNGGTYPSANTVQDLIDNNPQFWWDFGNSGIQTLCSYMKIGSKDLTITVLRGVGNINITGIPFVGGRPNDR